MAAILDLRIFIGLLATMHILHSELYCFKELASTVTQCYFIMATIHKSSITTSLSELETWIVTSLPLLWPQQGQRPLMDPPLQWLQQRVQHWMLNLNIEGWNLC